MNRCPECGQPILDRRAGVGLTPVKVRIFDVVKAAGIDGITSREIIQVVYEGDRPPRNVATVRAHIFQINELLAGTDLQIIVHDDRRHWFLTRRRDGVSNFVLHRASVRGRVGHESLKLKLKSKSETEKRK